MLYRTYKEQNYSNRNKSSFVPRIHSRASPASRVPNHPEPTSNTSLGTCPAFYAAQRDEISPLERRHGRRDSCATISTSTPPRNNILGPASSGTRQTGRTPPPVTLFDGCPFPAKPLLVADEAELVFPNRDIPVQPIPRAGVV